MSIGYQGKKYRGKELCSYRTSCLCRLCTCGPQTSHPASVELTGRSCNCYRSGIPQLHALTLPWKRMHGHDVATQATSEACMLSELDSALDDAIHEEGRVEG